MGRVGIGWVKAEAGVAASITTGRESARPGAKAVAVIEGTTVLEPESSAQHIPEMEIPSDAQQSSAAISAHKRQGHSTRTRLNAVTANRP